MDRTLQLRLVEEMFLLLDAEAKRLGIKGATFVRLIVEKALEDGSYRNVVVPQMLFPSQRIKKPSKKKI